MSKTTAIRTKSYGPFDVIGETAPQGRVFLQLPFQEVAGCRILVAVRDNFAQIPAQFVPSHEWPGAEITIWGNVQGYESVLKRQCVHMQTGPMGTVLDYAEGWDTVSFRAKNMNGGSVVGLAGIAPFPTQAAGFLLKVSVYVMPRSGFATPGDDNQTSNFGRAG